tara:strand:+ start:3666 stop:4304 length:639 start_codon:yes stop_codon:yes gene_type:complete
MIGVLNYGFGNLKSIDKALTFLDLDYQIINNETTNISNFDKLILPGVGSFDYGINKIKNDPRYEEILEAIDLQIPILGICLGMQLLFSSSTEGKYNKGLNLVKGDCISFSDNSSFNGRIPHVGFAPVDLIQSDFLFDGIRNKPYMYFIHSYMIPYSPVPSISLATTNYSGTKFISYVRKNNIVGMQFHPEKSQRVGLKLIENFAKSENAKFQ